MEPQYTQEQLKLMIAQAARLGFHDDVAHWEAELAKLQEVTL